MNICRYFTFICEFYKISNVHLATINFNKINNRTLQAAILIFIEV